MVLWNEKLPNILQAYTPDNIYNADETGIFYKMLPDKTMEFKDVNCHGGKKNKERITAPPSGDRQSIKPLLFQACQVPPHRILLKQEGMNDFRDLYRMGEETREEDA